MTFYQFDFHLNPMALILKLSLDMVKMYLNTKMKFVASTVQKL